MVVTRNTVISIASEHDINDFLGTERAQSKGRTLIKFLSGSDSADQTAVERAKENLVRFDLVGFAEDSPAFVRKLSSLIGASVPMPRKNIGPRNDLKAVLTSDDMVMDQIRELCKVDVEVYDFARMQLARVTNRDQEPHGKPG
jgi:hypothetical protein